MSVCDSMNTLYLLVEYLGKVIMPVDAFWVTRPGYSSRIRHRNALTERAWKDAVQGLGKRRLRLYTGLSTSYLFKY